MTNEYQNVLHEMPESCEHGDPLHWLFNNYNTIRKALDLAIALQPKPISEAPMDGTGFYGLIDGQLEYCRVKYNELYVLNNGDYNDGGYGRDYKCGEEDYSIPTHFYNISALPKPEDN